MEVAILNIFWQCNTRLFFPVLSLAIVLAWTGLVGADTPAGVHGGSLHGDLKYGPDFTHFDYVNPTAPKGGTVKLAAIGTFDSLHAYILKGIPAAGIGQIFDTLMTQSDDEPFSEYGLIAETIEIPDDYSWVAFSLRQEARFHDGSPMTVEDVIWTFNTLREKGRPFFRAYYAHVETVEKVGPRKVKFSFDQGQNRELPLILGQLPVFSKAYWSSRDFEKTTLESPLGSGPYKVGALEPGRSITYERVKDYWAANLPARIGTQNFDSIRYDYYRDTTVALEAFKAGQYDFRMENVSKNWATAYTGPAIDKGLIKKEELPDNQPAGMQGFVFNTRRPVFHDARVRQALAYGFDFEWTNKNLFYGAYVRTKSYFENSEMAATGLPSPEELVLLEPFRDQLPDEVFSKEYSPPKTDGSGNIRSNLRAALVLLKEAGWSVKDGKLVNDSSGEPLRFEILLVDPSMERIVLPFAKNLERLGVDARVRTVDTAQYQNRLDNFDFDMTTVVLRQSLSPGNEQLDFWSSERADVPGGRNLAGIKHPAVDALVDLLIAAPDRQSLVTRTRALDRVLLWGHYVIPHFHLAAYRVASWDKFGRPQTLPRYGLGFDTWWVDAKKETELKNKKSGLQ